MKALHWLAFAWERFAVLVFCGSLSAQEFKAVTAPADGKQALTGQGSALSPKVALTGDATVFSSVSALTTNLPRRAQVQVYLRERASSPQNRLVSVAPDGSPGNGDSFGAEISSNGRYVLFQSSSSNLVTNDPNNQPDLFLRDLLLGKTELISVGTNGVSGNFPSERGLLSQNGQVVVFESLATSLTKTQRTSSLGGSLNIYARDLSSGKTTLVTGRVNTSPILTDTASSTRLAAISDDGNMVLFYSDSRDFTLTNLPSVSAVDRLYLADLQAGAIDFVSRSPGNVYNYGVGGAAMNKNGAVVAFISNSRLVNSTNASAQTNVYYRVIPTGSLTEIPMAREFSTNMAGAQLFMSPSGSRLAISLPGAQISETSSILPRLLLWDAMYGALAEVDLTPYGRTGPGALTVSFLGNAVLFVGPLTNNPPAPPAINLFGETITIFPMPSGSFDFNSDASALAFEDSRPSVVGDRNGEADVYVYTSLPGTPILPQLASRAIEDGYISGDFRIHTVPDDQRSRDKAIFTSASSRLVAGDTNGFSDVFVWPRPDGPAALVSSSSTGGFGNGPSYDPALSADGHWAAFISAANNFAANDTNRTEDVFVKNLTSGELELLSVSALSTNKLQPPGSTRATVISADGRYVAFSTMRDDLLAGTTRDREHILVRDRTAGVMLNASRELETNSRFRGKPLAIFDSTLWLKSRTNVYRYNLTNDTLSFAGISDPDPAFNSDGTLAAMRRRSSSWDTLYTYNAVTGESNHLAGPTVTGNSLRMPLSISQNGTVAFVSQARLNSNDADQTNDVYITSANGPVLATTRQTINGTNLIEAPVISEDASRIFYRVTTQPRSTTPGSVPPATTEFYYGDLSGGQVLSAVLMTNGPMSMRATRFGDSILLAGDELYFYSAGPPDPDSDLDGLLDSWEMAAFGSLEQTANGDFDGDGISNLSEFLAGTDPTDSASVLRLSISMANPGTGDLTNWKLAFPPLPDRTLRLEYSDDLESASWNSITTQPQEDNGRLSVLIETEGSQRFYRLQALP